MGEAPRHGAIFTPLHNTATTCHTQRAETSRVHLVARATEVCSKNAIEHVLPHPIVAALRGESGNKSIINTLPR